MKVEIDQKSEDLDLFDEMELGIASIETEASP
jgi:hypothetical protein